MCRWVQQPCCVRKTLFQGTALEFFLCFPSRHSGAFVSEVGWGKLMWMSHRDWTLSHLFSTFATAHCNKNLFWLRSRAAQAHAYKHKHLEYRLTTLACSKTAAGSPWDYVFTSILTIVTVLSINSLLWRRSPIQSREQLVTPINSPATIAPAGTSCLVC